MDLLSYLIEHNRYFNLFGIAALIGIAALFSRNRSRIDVALIFKALAIQFLIGLAVLKTSTGKLVLENLSLGIKKIYMFADVGSAFIFGSLAQEAGTPWGFIFAIKVLPVIIFFGALTSLLFYWGVIQFFVGIINFVVQPVLRTSGAETLCAISNSFLGQTEAPLLVRHYLKDMTKSEMFVVMVSGMGTISGSILVTFASMGVPAEHMLTASVMAIPATIMMAKILFPETEVSTTSGGARIEMQSPALNAIDAVSQGTSDGLHLSINVAAMLISFLAFLAMFDFILGSSALHINRLFDVLHLSFRLPDNLSMGLLFSYVCKPFAYLLGFTGDEARAAGELIGLKVAVNELIAYLSMVKMHLSERTTAILTYALCGFSNFSCIGIQIGGIGALVPEKRAWLTELGFAAVFGAAMANLMSAMMAGLLL